MKFDNSWKPESKKPPRFVLVDMHIEYKCTGREAYIKGWWNGIHWEGARLTTSDKILKWKREYGG